MTLLVTASLPLLELTTNLKNWPCLCDPIPKECHLLIGNLWTSVYCILYIAICPLSSHLLDLLCRRHYNSILKEINVARYTSEKAAAMFGGRFEMVLGASQRARELKNGSAQRVDGKDASTVVTALREIEAGKYTREEWLQSIPRKRKGQRDEHFA